MGQYREDLKNNILWRVFYERKNALVNIIVSKNIPVRTKEFDTEFDIDSPTENDINAHHLKSERT